ncbi:hypothetical protein FRB99_005819 [Tulasnella sp. 403]|nr:hypothetical protein FRB99_005819 [Tulasnella sp. 403]
MVSTPSPRKRPVHARHSLAITPARDLLHHLERATPHDVHSVHRFPSLQHTLKRSSFTSSFVHSSPHPPRQPPVHDSDEDHSEDEPETSADEEDRADNGASTQMPATPAPRKHASNLSLSELSAARRRNSNRRISNIPVKTPSKPIPAPCFNATPKAIPRTPDNIDEWRTTSGAESMTRLSLHDIRRDPPKENTAPSAFTIPRPANERKRTGSSGSYLPPRYQKNGSPPNPIERCDSPPSSRTGTSSRVMSTPVPLTGRRVPKSPMLGSPSSPFGESTRFPSLSFESATPSRQLHSPDPFPPLPPSSFHPANTSQESSLRVRRPSSPHSNGSLSTSTSTNSNLSFDDIFPPPGSARRPRIARKFKPKPSVTGSALGTDESDGGVGDVSFGSNSSYGRPISGEVSPLVVTEDDEQAFQLVTPSLDSGTPSGWSNFWAADSNAPPAKADKGLLDPDELLFHMARNAHGADQAAAKPVMPDTPMKRHPPKPRVWQSTGKSWTMGPSERYGTICGAPRKSLPGRLQDVSDQSPDSESDPSPSKPSFASVSRLNASARRKSSGFIGSGERASATEGQPLPALAITLAGEGSNGTSQNVGSMSLQQRAGFLRRVSSGVLSFSGSSDIGTDGSLTPRKEAVPSTWKAPPLVLQPSNESVSSLGEKTADTGQPSPMSKHSNMGPPPTPLNKRPSLRSATQADMAGPAADSYATELATGSPFVLPKVAPPTPGPVKSFISSRPSLTTSGTPARPSLRRESHPMRPLGAYGWGTPAPASSKARAPALFGYASGTESRSSRKSTGWLGVSEGVRRPRSFSRLAFTPENDLDDVVMERSGRFERDFARPLDGPGVLGKGTFGQVFRVIEKKGMTDKVFAVKRSKPYEGERHRARLLEEVEVLRHLTMSHGPCESTPSTRRLTQGHDNVLHYVDAWEQDRMLFIQTELCELGSLSDFLLEYGRIYDRLDEARLWKIASEIANGLHHIHHSGVLHLDLKPANIFVTAEGRLRIGDFGMATRWPRPDAGTSNAGGGFEREGDREYLAAEILVGQYGPAADVFSFGMIMLESAGNIVVPSNGEPWHRLRHDDFLEVCLTGLSDIIVGFIKDMMRSDHTARPDVNQINSLDAIVRTRELMKRNRLGIRDSSGKMFRASAFATEPSTFLVEVLGAEVVASIRPAPLAPAKLTHPGDAMDTDM